ncbi:hypothetical protein APSETT444_002734 [Aspergillus pseudonomiae]
MYSKTFLYQTSLGSSTGLSLDTTAYDGGFVSASRPPSPPGQPDGVGFDRSSKNVFTLPATSETKKLITQYFTDTGLLFPYIHPETFLETYDAMLHDNTKVRRTWLGLLNMVLAMAVITTTPGGSPANVRIAESDIFYQRSLSLCGKEILRGTTLEVVQYLLLMGQYLQGTQKSVQAWTVHGLAVKAALQLGLHSKDASRAFPRLEQETRLRTWFGCVVLDRTLSMTFGRPAAIPNSYVKLELPGSDICKAIDLLYGQNLGCDPPLPIGEAVAHVFSLEQELFSWERQLPDAMRLINSDGVEEAHQVAASDYDFAALRFRIILTLRYANYRLLLHRPILVRFLDACGGSQSDPQQLQLLRQLGLSSMQICADSTMQIIDLVYDIVHRSDKLPNLLGAWWFSLYYSIDELSSGVVVVPSMRLAIPSTADVDISPLGMEFGEFMVDGDIFASFTTC